NDCFGRALRVALAPVTTLRPDGRRALTLRAEDFAFVFAFAFALVLAMTNLPFCCASLLHGGDQRQMFRANLRRERRRSAPSHPGIARMAARPRPFPLRRQALKDDSVPI